MPYFRIQGPNIQVFTYGSGITSLVLSPLSNELHISEDSLKWYFVGTVSALPPRLTCGIRYCTALASQHLMPKPKPKPKNPSLYKQVFIQKSMVQCITA